MLTIAELNAFGADTEEGLRRCYGNESFYLSLVKMMPGDAGFERLYDAVGRGDLETAFDAAHALKGALGNLSLTPLYEPVSRLTELLRARTETDYSDLMKEIRGKRDALLALCADEPLG